MTQHPEVRSYIDPMFRHESDTSVRSAQRLQTVVHFLKREDLATLSPLETHVVEQAIGSFLKDGKIEYGALNTIAHIDVPERIYMDDIDEQKDDVARTLLGLEAKGIFLFDEEHGTYALGLESV